MTDKELIKLMSIEIERLRAIASVTACERCNNAIAAR